MYKVVYTDGSIKPYRRLVQGCCAAWAFVVTERERYHDHNEGEVLAWAYGYVCTDPTCHAYIGAGKHTVNTAELSAIYWALFYLHRNKLSNATIYTDSQYSRRAVKGYNMVMRNTELIRRIRDVYIGMGHRLLWVRGHSKAIFNDLADGFAKARLNGLG